MLRIGTRALAITLAFALTLLSGGVSAADRPTPDYDSLIAGIDGLDSAGRCDIAQAALADSPDSFSVAQADALSWICTLYDVDTLLNHQAFFEAKRRLRTGFADMAEDRQRFASRVVGLIRILPYRDFAALRKELYHFYPKAMRVFSRIRFEKFPDEATAAGIVVNTSYDIRNSLVSPTVVDEIVDTVPLLFFRLGRDEFAFEDPDTVLALDFARGWNQLRSDAGIYLTTVLKAAEKGSLELDDGHKAELVARIRGFAEDILANDPAFVNAHLLRLAAIEASLDCESYAPAAAALLDSYAGDADRLPNPSDHAPFCAYWSESR